MRALVELALASGRGPVSAALIAKRQDLSVAYLEQLLHRLKKRGLVNSTRGPRGGYVLARGAQAITMDEVVAVLDGNGAWNDKGRNGSRRTLLNGRGRAAVLPRKTGKSGDAKEAHRYAQRIAQTVWRCVHERLTESLGSITLQDLCDEVKHASGEPLEHRYVFHI